VIANNIIYKGADKNGYTAINSNKFLSAYYRYEVYINYLINREIIERDYYIKGKKPFGYRFSELFKRDVKINRIIYYPNEMKDKKEDKNSNQNCIHIDPQLLKRLKKDFKSCTFDFDLNNSQLDKKYDIWGNYIEIGKWLRNNLNLHKWVKGYCTFNFTSNRLYTNFTSLSSNVRKNNIKLNNESIVEFDIHNSFPLMLSIFMRNENPNVINDYDFAQYCTSVVSGTFYNSLTLGLNSVRNCNNKGNEEDYSARLLSKPEVKQLFQVYLNGSIGRSPYLNGMRPFINEYMRLQFPCIHELILETKKEGKRNVYDTLVKLETQFIFDVIKELYKKYDGIKILTCHDALYVPISFKDRVQDNWDEKMKEFVKNLPFDDCEDDLDLQESSISIFEEVDVNSSYMNKKIDYEKDISFFEEDDDDLL